MSGGGRAGEGLESLWKGKGEAGKSPLHFLCGVPSLKRSLKPEAAVALGGYLHWGLGEEVMTQMSLPLDLLEINEGQPK